MSFSKGRETRKASPGPKHEMKTSGEEWNIATYLRIRPPLGREYTNVNYEVLPSSNGLSSNDEIFSIDIPEDADPGIVHNNSLTGKLNYEFNQVFDAEHATQEDVFNTVARGRIIEAVDGINATIFAYGQTGSGKTYSIFGGDNYQERGLIPRTISLIFAEMKQRQAMNSSFKFKFKVSFTELYKESIYDLLDENCKQNRTQPVEKWPTVELLEGDDGVAMRNLNVFEIDSEEDGLRVFFMGNSNRITSSTLMNSISSRSHAVFTAILDTEQILDGSLVYTAGKINLVDLAGSERLFKTQGSAEGASSSSSISSHTHGPSSVVVREGMAINLSLHYLEQVIVSLREASRSNKGKGNTNGNGFVPYRNSALTSMLRDSLGGNCKSCFLLTVTLERAHFEETVSTCRFGMRCRNVKVMVGVNTEISLSDQVRVAKEKIKLYERKIEDLEEAVTMVEKELHREQERTLFHISPRTLNDDEKTQCKQCVQSLLTSAKQSLSVKMNRLRSLEELQGSMRDDAAAAILGDTSEEERIIDESQEHLYATVSGMDKAVLVELATALGGLVQSMYIDREMAKEEEASKLQKAQQMIDPSIQKQQEEQTSHQIIRSRSTREFTKIITLPPTLLTMIHSGAVFIKVGRYSNVSTRLVFVSSDLTKLCWRSLIGVDRAKVFTVPFSSFTRVSIDRGNPFDQSSQEGTWLIHLTAHPGTGAKNYVLEYANSVTAEDNKIKASEWSDVFNYLIYKANE